MEELSRIVGGEEKLTAKARVFIEALPHILELRGSTVLVKVGGSVMEDDQLTARMVRDVVLLHAIGANPVVVHGGGKAITARMRAEGIEARFVNGLRITDERSIALVDDVLENVVQKRIVEMIQEKGGQARAVSGKRVFRARKIDSRSDDTGEPVDLGFVGEVTRTDPGPVIDAMHHDAIPVVTPLGAERGGKVIYNINADTAAGALAIQLKSVKAVFVSDVPGIMRNPEDPRSVLSNVNESMVQSLIKDRIIAGGMLPKVESALGLVAAGVKSVHFVDGRLPHSLLLELLTDDRVGTRIGA